MSLFLYETSPFIKQILFKSQVHVPLHYGCQRKDVFTFIKISIQGKHGKVFNYLTRMAAWFAFAIFFFKKCNQREIYWNKSEMTVLKIHVKHCCELLL